ncbi:MAG TPA: hypothetical protein VIK38_06200 [Coriobacteriia bacterium]
MPTKTKPRGRAAIHDPAGEAWHAEARARWAKAEAADPETPIAAYDAPPLPKWFAPAHVKRELLGRFLLDRDTGVLHDVSAATEGCRVDAIRNGTFFHFASELPPDGTDQRDCPLCIGEG